jgi:hypothetical protein
VKGATRERWCSLDLSARRGSASVADSRGADERMQGRGPGDGQARIQACASSSHNTSRAGLARVYVSDNCLDDRRARYWHCGRPPYGATPAPSQHTGGAAALEDADSFVCLSCGPRLRAPTAFRLSSGQFVLTT